MLLIVEGLGIETADLTMAGVDRVGESWNWENWMKLMKWNEINKCKNRTCLYCDNAISLDLLIQQNTEATYGAKYNVLPNVTSNTDIWKHFRPQYQNYPLNVESKMLGRI